MDIDDIRRANIRLLEQEAGSPAAAADRVGLTYSGYINYRKGVPEPKTGKIRGMRKETAWRFEDAFGKPRGWLDIDHSSYLLPDRDAAFIRRVEQEVARYDVPEHVRQAVLTLIASSPPRAGGSPAATPPAPQAKAA